MDPFEQAYDSEVKVDPFSAAYDGARTASFGRVDPFAAAFDNAQPQEPGPIVRMHYGLDAPPVAADPMAGPVNLQAAINSPEGMAMAKEMPGAAVPSDVPAMQMVEVPVRGGELGLSDLIAGPQSKKVPVFKPVETTVVGAAPSTPIDMVDALRRASRTGDYQPSALDGGLKGRSLGEKVLGYLADTAEKASDKGLTNIGIKLPEFYASSYLGLREAFGVDPHSPYDDFDNNWMTRLAKQIDRASQFEQGKTTGRVKELRAEGDVGRAAVLSISNSLLDTMAFLKGIKTLKLGYGGGAENAVGITDKVVSTLTHAQKIAFFAAMTQRDATPEERLNTWKVSSLYMSTPAVSGLLKNPAGVKALDLALNSMVSAFKGEGDYRSILKDDKLDGFEKTMALVNTLGADVVFSAMTKSLGADARARQAVDQLNAIDAQVRASMRPSNAQMTKVGGDVLPNRLEVVAQAQGERLPVNIPTTGTGNQRNIANQIDAALAEERRAAGKQAKAEMVASQQGDSASFARWQAQVRAEEEQARTERLDPQRTENLNLMAQYVAKSKGVGEREARNVVARLSYNARRQLLASIRGERLPDIPVVAPEAAPSLARPVVVAGADQARQREVSVAGKEYAKRLQEEQAAAQAESDRRLERAGIEQHVRELQKAGLGEQTARDIAEPLTPREQARLDALKQSDYQAYSALRAQHGDDSRAILRDSGQEPVIITTDERGSVVERKRVDGRGGDAFERAYDSLQGGGVSMELRGAQDLGRESRATQAGGFVAFPDNAALKRVAVSAGRFARRWFTSSGNMDAGTRAAQTMREWGGEAALVEGLFTRNDFKGIRKMLVAEHGRDAVQSALADVVYGDIAPRDFATRFGVPPDHPAIVALDSFSQKRKQMSVALADMLDKTGNPTLADRVRGADSYVSRFYLKHAMGDEFVPKQEDYEAALVEVRAGLEDAVDSLQKRAGKAAGKGFRGNVVDYLSTGDPSALAGLSGSKRAEIEQLGRSYKGISRVISDVRDSGDGIEFERDVAAFEDAARSTIEYYLHREQGGGGGAVDVSNLKRRFLGEAFRKLYGEVRDPVFAAAATAENQARMLNHLTFFNRLAQEAENKSWSGTPSERLGTMKRLDDDRVRYGLLAGKYVTPELYEAIHGEPARMGLTKVYKSTLGTMRMLKLVGLKTIVRNYATGLTGFALGSGDVFRPNYWSNFERGNKLMAGIARNDPVALAELKDLVEVGAFSFRGNTQMQEVQQLFSMDPRKKLGAGIQRLGELYSLIDLPTKAAAYYTNYDMQVARGVPVERARAQAAEHVQEYYQNPQALPKAVMKVSRLPLSDYPGYFADSIRIKAHQSAHAMRSAQQGDLLPALGLLLSTGLSVGLAYAGGDEGRKLWRMARQKLAGRAKDVVSSSELEKPQQQAMREFVPDYYRDAPLVMWSEKRKDGTVRMYYTVTGGNGAFPLDDMLFGALQGSDSPDQFMERFGRSVVQSRLSPGMLPTALWKSVTGDDISGSFHTTGPSDVWGVKRPEKDKIYAESAIRLLSDVYGGQFGYKLMQLKDVADKQRDGLVPVAGSYTPYQTYGQVLGSMIDPARTYEITPEEAARMVRNRIKQYQDGIAVSKQMAGAEMRSFMQFGKSSEDAKSQSVSGQQYRAEYIKEIGSIVQAAKMAFKGVVDETILQAVVKDALPNASNVEIMMIIGGVKNGVVPYVPEPRFNQLQKIMMGGSGSK